jgi:cell division transport system permease protein
MNRELLHHVLRLSLLSVRRHPVAHVLCAFLCAVCLYGLVWIGYSLLRAPLLLPSWLKGADVVIYLQAGASLQQEQQALEELKTWPEIGSVRPVPKEEARNRLEKQLGSWKGILAGMRPDYLQSSMEVTLKDSLKAPEDRGKIIDRLRLVPNVVEVLYGNGGGDTVKSILDWIERGGWLFAGLFVLFFTCVQWTVTIVSIFGSQDQMEVLWWVGAPDWLIRLPVLLASWATAVAATVLAMALFALTVRYLEAELPVQFAALFSVEPYEWLLLGFGMICGSLMMGSLGVYLGMGHARRFCSDVGSS